MKKYIVRIRANGEPDRFVVSFRSYASADGGKVTATTEKPEEARRFSMERAVMLARRNGGTVIEAPEPKEQ